MTARNEPPTKPVASRWYGTLTMKSMKQRGTYGFIARRSSFGGRSLGLILPKSHCGRPSTQGAMVLTSTKFINRAILGLTVTAEGLALYWDALPTKVKGLSIYGGYAAKALSRERRIRSSVGMQVEDLSSHGTTIASWRLSATGGKDSTRYYLIIFARRQFSRMVQTAFYTVANSNPPTRYLQQLKISSGHFDSTRYHDDVR